jgi:hypothetical protein
MRIYYVHTLIGAVGGSDRLSRIYGLRDSAFTFLGKVPESIS